MSHNNKKRMKRCRRVQSDLGYHSTRTAADKCRDRLELSPGKPGKTGKTVAARRPKSSQYSKQLTMKQLIRYYYNVREKKFRKYYGFAASRTGSTGFNLLSILESRLDNVVYRMGFAATRAEARQLVSHGAIEVNGFYLNIPSYLVNVGDSISVREKSQKQSRIVYAFTEVRKARNDKSTST